MILKLYALNAISLNTTHLLSCYVSCKCFRSFWVKEFCEFKTLTLYLEVMIYTASGEGTTAYQCVLYYFLALYAHNRPPLQLKVLCGEIRSSGSRVFLWLFLLHMFLEFVFSLRNPV